MKKPNILFLMSDEHRADVAGYENNTVIRTPNLDKLAEEGAVFTNCYTPSPVCIPARQAIMAGQHCKTCECVNFADDLAPFYNTFASWLSKHGYFTCACGKLHHTGIDQMQGWTQRVSGDIQVGNQFIERTPEGQDQLCKMVGYKWSDNMVEYFRKRCLELGYHYQKA